MTPLLNLNVMEILFEKDLPINIYLEMSGLLKKNKRDVGGVMEKKYFIYKYEWEDGSIYIGQSHIGANRYGRISVYKDSPKVYPKKIEITGDFIVKDIKNDITYRFYYPKHVSDFLNIRVKDLYKFYNTNINDKYYLSKEVVHNERV